MSGVEVANLVPNYLIVIDGVTITLNCNPLFDPRLHHAILFSFILRAQQEKKQLYNSSKQKQTAKLCL